MLGLMALSGKEVLPLVEGGKGIGVTDGHSAGAWARSGGVGTFSGVNADYYDENGHLVPLVFRGRTRRERHHELVEHSILGGISQARLASDIAGKEGRIHVNVLWEAGGAERILHGILERAATVVHGVTCGAGMPYRLPQIAERYGVWYYPIVSSARAFRALWKRSFRKIPQWLGGVVYEDPWRAGGHNGLTNAEDPENPEGPYERVRSLRSFMNEAGLARTPIIMAGGVWFLREWKGWIDNPEIGPVAFQLGTRPLLTRESPISSAWKDLLRTLKMTDIRLNRFSPTGFWSSAVRNDFLRELDARNRRQVPFRSTGGEGFDIPFSCGGRDRTVYLREGDDRHAAGWVQEGYSRAMKTPDQTLVFVSPDKFAEIRKDQIECKGCLSHCLFSNWSTNEEGKTGRPPDPRSFCIQKTLHSIIHRGDLARNLMFAGHSAFRFAEDPFYNGGFVPTVRQLIDRILSGD